MYERSKTLALLLPRNTLERSHLFTGFASTTFRVDPSSLEPKLQTLKLFF